YFEFRKSDHLRVHMPDPPTKQRPRRIGPIVLETPFDRLDPGQAVACTLPAVRIRRSLRRVRIVTFIKLMMQRMLRCDLDRGRNSTNARFDGLPSAYWLLCRTEGRTFCLHRRNRRRDAAGSIDARPVDRTRV